FAQSAVEFARRQGNIPAEALDAMLGATEDTIGAHIGTIRMVMEGYYDAFLPSAGDRAAIETELQGLFELLSSPHVDSTRALDEWMRLVDEYIISPPEPNLQGFVTAWNEVESAILSAGEAAESADMTFSDFLTKIDGAITSTLDEAAGVTTLSDALSVLEKGLGDGSISAQELTAYIDNLKMAIADGHITAEMATEMIIEYARAHDEAAAAMERMAAVDERFGASARREDRVEQLHAEREAMEARRDALAEWAEELERINQDALSGFFELTGDTDFTSQLNLTQAATDASVLAENLNDVAAALSNATRIAIQNTDAIGSQMQSLEDWALELINVKGEWGEIDDLLNEGRISLDQYNDAQQAQADITAANATVQRDLLAIQAMQAPILAESATAMAEYVEQLRLMNDGTEDGARQQMAALALMDSTVQTQMQTLFDTYQLMGQLGPQGRDAFQ